MDFLIGLNPGESSMSTLAPSRVFKQHFTVRLTSCPAVLEPVHFTEYNDNQN
jgi:hypothetical protein